VIAASSVINDMLDTKHEQMQEAELKTEALKNKLQGLFDFSKELFITLPEYTKGTKFTFDISPVKLCDHLYDNTVSPKQVYTVLSNTHIDYLVQLQRTMKELFDRLDFEPAHELQIIALPTSSTTKSRSAQAVLPPGSTLSPGPSTPGSGASSSLLLQIHQTRQAYPRSL
jgi:hypothetical protein